MVPFPQDLVLDVETCHAFPILLHFEVVLARLEPMNDLLLAKNNGVLR